MSPAAESGIEIGVGVMAICLALFGSQVLLAFKPRRPRLIHWAVWTGGCLVAVLPLIAFGAMTALSGLATALLLGSSTWGLIELRWAWRRWFYADLARKQAEEVKRRTYHPMSFDAD